MTYAEKLKDPRWQKKRLEVFAAANFICSECGTDKKTLHVHHPFYKRGLEPWEYPTWALICICKDCHEQRAVCERFLIVSVKTMKSETLELLSLVIDDAFAIGYSPRAIVDAIRERLEVPPTEKEIL